MAQQIINTNKGTADSLKIGATKINSNFTELYSILATDQISIPALVGNSGKYLTTNGTAVSWQPLQFPDAVVTTGSYANPIWITSLDYSKLTNRPNLANYLTTGSLSVSTITPSGNGALSYSSGVLTYTPPNLATVATSGSYADLTNKPTITAIPTQTANGGKYLTTDGTTLSWATVTGGTTDYNNLTNKPTIPAAQVQSDWNAVSGLGVVLNKPTLFTGSYTDLTNKPTLFSGVYTDLTSKPTLFSGSYDDLTNKPTIPGAYSATSINALSDVDTVNNLPTAGQPLVWNAVSSTWVPGSVVSGSLSTLSGVTITSPAVGQVLKYNGSVWINDADSVSGGAGVGTVTTVSITAANGFTGSVATASSTPAITISTSISGMLRGTGTAITAATAGTDYQSPISLTTTGSNGAATFSSNVLNIPQYAGDTVGPATSTDNAITRFDTTTGKLLQNSLVTISDLGAIVAPIASSIIPFHYDNQAGFPSAVTYHGAIAHSHADEKMYFAHGGVWLALANATDIPSAQSVTGIVKSSGTTLSAAISGTDYQAPIGTISGLVKGNGANALTAAVAGTDYQSAQSVTGIVKSSGTTRLAATSGTDYAPGTSALATGIVKSTTTTGVLSIAVAGTDFQAPVSATGILKSSGVSGNVTAAVAGTDYQSAQSVTGIVKSNGTTRSAAVAGTDYQSAQSVTGMVKSSGTTRSVATSGTDYAPGTSALATGIVKSTTTTGALSIAVAGTDYQTPIGTISGMVKGNGANALTAAVAGTDYQTPIGTISGLVKGNGANALTAAVAGTDYQAPVSATGVLKSSGVSGNVTAAVAGTDFQSPITLTTTGSNGAATFSGNILNIPQYVPSGGSGTVTSVSVATANGFSGTVATDTTTPTITIATNITGVLKGNGTSISAATSGTDYQAPIVFTTSGSSGAATFNGTTLNIPQYASGATTFSGLSDATSASLTVDEIYLPAITRLVITTPVFNYNIDQYSGDNPAIYAISGTTIAFNLQQGGSHPFLLQQNNANITTANLIHVSTSGVVSTGSSAQGQVSGTLYWKIPGSVSGTFRYICQNHSSMVGTITVKDIAAI